MATTKTTIKEIPVNQIHVQEDFDRFQSKHDVNEYKKGIVELAQNIQSEGLLQPIIVFQESPSKYLLLAGERRFNAVSKILKAKKIMASITPVNNPMITISENIQREDLTGLEKGQWIHKAVLIMAEKDPKMPQEKIFEILGNEFGKAPRTLRDWEKVFTKATEEEKKAIREGKTTSTQVSRNIQKRNPKKRTPNKGQVVKRTAKAFNTAVDKITDQIKFIGSNAREYKDNEEVKANLQRLEDFVIRAKAKLEMIDTE